MKIILREFSELESVKQLVNNMKPVVVKHQSKQQFIIRYQMINDNSCKYSIPEGNTIIIPEGYHKFVVTATNQGSAESQFKRQARKETHISNLKFYYDV